MNFQGIIIGAITFFIIGIFHPIVIKAEYYWGAKTWPLFLIIGLISVSLSVFFADSLVSSLSGIFGFTCLWSIRELFQQAQRVKRGWFPQNPKRKEEIS